MVTLSWLRGLVAHRRARVASTALGVAVGVALLASIGTFLSSTTATMTQRAIARVPVDWQVQAASGANPSAVLAQVRRFAGVRRALPVGYADTTGLQAKTGGSVQQTGPGKVLGIPAGYARAFPGELRTLSGRGSGVLLAQQTAANLHARPGDTVTIGRAGLSPASVKVDGVVDLPAADSLFQRVGAPVGAQPQAPPDNVILLPQPLFGRIEGPLATAPASPMTCRAARAPRSPRSPGTLATSRPASRAAAWSATTSAAHSTRPVRTRSTRSCCSCSWASPASSSPGW
jgi:putative ABC transport system permease protein